MAAQPLGAAIAELVPGTEARARAREREAILKRWREQCREVDAAGAAFAEAVRGLCAIYLEADAADPGRIEPLGLGLPSTLVYAFLGESMAGLDQRNPGNYQLWREQCITRGWLPAEAPPQ